MLKDSNTLGMELWVFQKLAEEDGLRGEDGSKWVRCYFWLVTSAEESPIKPSECDKVSPTLPTSPCHSAPSVFFLSLGPNILAFEEHDIMLADWQVLICWIGAEIDPDFRFELHLSYT